MKKKSLYTLITGALLASLTYALPLTAQNEIKPTLAAKIKSAQQSTQKSPALLDFSKVMKAANKVNRKRFPDADVVLVDDYQKITYKQDGTSVTVDDFYEKILTEKGRRNNGSTVLQFALPYSRVEVPLLEIIKPNGRRVPIDVKKYSRVMVDSSQMGQNIYNPNRKQLQIAIPGLQIGDLLHTIYVRTYVKVRMKDAYSDFFSVQSTHPILKYTIELDAPKQLPLQKYLVKDKIEKSSDFKKTEKAGRIIYKWTFTNIPRIFPEPKMPAPYRVSQRLLISTVKKWQDISKWYWKLCEPHLQKITPEMKLKVKELTAGLKSREAKIAAIFQFVSKEIRYMGITPETVAPGNEPHDVDMTFNNRYGVCRDKAALLVAMLRIGGYKAFPVLFLNGPKKDKEVPNNFFNHAICCVQNPNGSYSLMDPTDETTAKLLPSYLCDKSYLVCTPTGETLMTSTVRKVEKNMLHISTVGKVTATGALEAKTVLNFEGINDNVYRGAFSRWKAEERQQFFARAIKRAVPGAELLTLEIKPKDLRDMTKPLTINISYRAGQFLIAGKSRTMLPAPWFGRAFGVVSFILRGTGLDKRRYPFQLFTTCGVNEQFSLALPVKKLIALPKAKTIDLKTLFWSQKLNFKAATLLGKSKFLLKTMEFSPKQYLKLKTSLQEIEYQKRKMPIFASLVTHKAVANQENKNAKQAVELEAVILKSEIDIVLKSTSAWQQTVTVEKKIMNYAGVKNNSELHLDYNPAWETVKLLSAEVIEPDGKKHIINPQEINLMDAAWNGSAPRYPPGKILVASLPGVKIGSVVKYKIEYSLTKRPYFSLLETFRSSYPLNYKRLTLTVPQSIKLKINSIGVEHKQSSAAGTVTHSFSIKAQPPIKSENYTPPAWSFAPLVTVSSISFKAYAEKINYAMMKNSVGSQLIRNFVAKLLKDIPDDGDKILLIRNFVAKNIRSAGPAFTKLPLSAIANAETVFKDRYGNSADRAVLLLAMLKAAGFTPEAVLVSNVQSKSLITRITQVPQPNFFPTLLVRVKTGNSYIYLNDTNQYAELGSAAHDECFALAADGKVITVAVAKAMKNSRSENFTLLIDNSGKATITKQIWCNGMSFAAANRQFSEMTPELRKRYFQRVVTAISQSATATSKLKTDFKSYPGQEQFTVTVDRFAVTEGKYLYLALPENIFANIIKVGEPVRDNPYSLSKTHIEQLYNIELPKNSAKILLKPATLSWKAPANGGSFTISCKQTATNKLTIKCVVDFKSTILSAEQYSELIAISNQLSSPAMKIILIETK
jgi:transglutaminase-like putative cysteine protease